MIKNIMLLSLSMLLFTTAGWAQEEAMTDRKKQKLERKKAEKAKRQANYNAILKLLDEGNFVIEANQYANRYGQMLQLDENTNFVAASDGSATVQLAFPGAGPGYNGLGGVTVDGRLTRLEILKKDPKKGVSFRMSVFGGGFASADLFVDVGTDGRATMRYNGMRGNQFTMRGFFHSLDNSAIYKGMTLF